MKDETLRQYFDIYTDRWKLFKKYSNPTADEQFWKKLTDESIAIREKYPKDNELATAVMIATLEEINNVYKQKAGV